MPGLSGFELVERIRKMPKLAYPTILMLSSARGLQDVSRSRKLGISVYLTKPVRRAALHSAIKTALRKPGKHAPGRGVEIKTRGAARLRVLVAEDNAVNQKLATSILERAGHEAIVVSNGKDAVDAVKNGKFDVVLMDVQMPLMGGFEATQLIREAESTESRIPIIAVTARAMKGDREACFAAGMDGYIPKPIQTKKLLDLIVELAGARTIAAEPEKRRKAKTGADPSRGDRVLDERALLVTVDGNRQLAGELATIFLDELNPRVREIEAAIHESDATRLQFAAHTLKGSAASLSATQVAASASELETMARKSELAGAEKVFARLESELKGLSDRLTSLKQEA
jgi:CheY-like chemotaxis protein/HPt (histidine-containing phosphotransfer) domain-containing protein